MASYIFINEWRQIPERGCHHVTLPASFKLRIEFVFHLKTNLNGKEQILSKTPWAATWKMDWWSVSQCDCSCYHPHPKDGEGNVFTGVCLSTGGSTPVTGPRSILAGTPRQEYHLDRTGVPQDRIGYSPRQDGVLPIG